MRLIIIFSIALIGTVALAGSLEENEKFKACKNELIELERRVPFSKPLKAFEAKLRQFCNGDLLVAIEPAAFDYIRAPSDCGTFADKVGQILDGPVCGQLKHSEIMAFHEQIEVGSNLDRYIGVATACMNIMQRQHGPRRVPGHLVPT